MPIDKRLLRTFRQIINEGRESLTDVWVILEDEPLHYYLMKYDYAFKFKDAMMTDFRIDVPTDKLDTYGYHTEIDGVPALVTTVRSDVSMYLRVVLRKIQITRRPSASNVTLTEDLWLPYCDRGPDYKDPPQPAWVPNFP